MIESINKALNFLVNKYRFSKEDNYLNLKF